ncbi:MAG: hypothetical protein C5B51_07740 [Terriglobia bacterium]|nr:MAG: hypothetical protein C5B51_07740 [Terriglobia bacterium]
MTMNRLSIMGAAMLVFVTAATPQERRLRAGAAKVDITPPQSELMLSSDFVHDPLFVRAIVVDNGATCAVLVGLDIGGTDDAIMGAALPRAAASSKCPADNFLISATHTHSASTQGLGVAPAAAKRVADAIVAAVDQAKSRLAPARFGFGTTKVDLNVNRDLYAHQTWSQAPNPDGPSDKTLAVAALIGEDNVPIGVYMNYGMHPINFYLSGVISADFPGAASRYVERYFSERTIAVFSQGTSGDQNPALMARALTRIRNGEGAQVETVTRNVPLGQESTQPRPNFNPAAAASSRPTITSEHMAAYKEAIERTNELVTMEGSLIGASAIEVMRDRMDYLSNAAIWGGQTKFTCAGRDRLDAANPARENVFPGYKEGADVNLKVGVLRIGDVDFASINGEVYSPIGMRLKAKAPSNKTIVVTLANGRANSGYIYSDDAYNHLSFQVIGSRLQPGCAEDKITSNIIDLERKSGQ